MKFKIITSIILLILGYFMFFTDFTYKLSLSNIQKEIYEDYKFYWEFAEENFATYYVMENDKELQESIYNKYKNLIVDCQSYNDFSTFILSPMIDEMFSKLNHHTSVLNNSFYNSLYRSYNANLENPTNINSLNKSEYLLSILSQSKSYYKLEENDKNAQNTNYYVNKNMQFKEVDKDVAYIKLSTMLYNDELYNILIDYIIEASKYENIIIDIRGNSGGSTMMVYPFFDYLSSDDIRYEATSLLNYSSYNKPFIDMSFYGLQNEFVDISLHEEIDDKVLSSIDSFFTYESIYFFNENKYTGFDGDIYIIVDENVFSASESFTAISKRSGFATIVGKNATRGDGLGVGGPNLFMLPNSEIIVRYNCSFALNDDDSLNIEVGTTPDIIIPQNRDEIGFVVEYINDLKKSQSIN